MALSKTATTDFSIKVTRIHDFGKGTIAFDMVVNGVTIYGCRHIEAKGKSFVSFPQYKGNDGKYWSYAYFKITDETLAEIEKQISAML